MSNPAHESSPALVCAVDHDSDMLPYFKSVTDEQGLRLRFFSSAAELRDKVPLSSIMALVLDLEVDHSDAIALQRELMANDVPPSVMLTVSDRHSDAVIESLGLGAIALLSRPWVPELLAHYLGFAQVQYSERRRLNHKLQGFRQTLSSLTERQRSVLELAATGMPNKLIATKIDVSQRTVETERSRLLDAFGTSSYADAMICYGEYRVLEQVERIRKRTMLQRLGMHAATTMIDPVSEVFP